MQAMMLRGSELRVEEIARPEPGPMQVLARVRASGICGSDLHFARFAPQMIEASRGSDPAGWSAMDLDRGVVMGHEFVAEVLAAGAGAEAWVTGTRIISVPVIVDHAAPRGMQSIGYSSDYPGAYGEYVLMSAPLLLRVPDHVSDEIAATNEPCAVGLHAVRETRLQPNEHALVMGAGPIGMMTLLWLKREGVRHVTVTELSAPRRALAAQMGADLVLDPRDGDVAQQIAAAAGDAPPVVFECIGVPGTLAQAMTLAARRGRVIVAGVCMVEDQIRPMIGINKQLSLQFVLGYSAEEFAESLAALADGSIDTAPLVTRTISLAELPAAFASLSDPRDCKVVVRFAPEAASGSQ